MSVTTNLQDTVYTVAETKFFEIDLSEMSMAVESLLFISDTKNKAF